MMGNFSPIDCGDLGGGEAQRAALGRRLLLALQGPGFAALRGHGLEARGAEVLAAARAAFALPAADKDALHIRRSPCFRGYSEMKNARDWREQLHFAAEEPALAAQPAPAKDDAAPPATRDPALAAQPAPAEDGAAPPATRDPSPWTRLRGPNLWPAALGAPFREALLAYLAEGGALGAALLSALALGLGLDGAALDPGADPYLLLKLICYHPQPAQAASAAPRPGVAPHCDWSLVTLLLSDAPGLEVRGADGRWRPATAETGEFLLNAGELLELASGGAVAASPHRVINPSAQSSRLGIPLFLNPDLGFSVAALLPEPRREAAPEAEHVHRVLPPGPAPRALHFGESEWRRKGLGRWCHDPACLR